MSEIAERLSDGQHVKIGTCENMYYLRFEDRRKVRALPNNLDVNNPTICGELRFRLPFPDEDGIQPGDYRDDFNRGERLYRAGELDFPADPETAKDVGTIQLRHDSGLLLNVPCYHGLKLPDVVGKMKAFWNGKSWAFELVQLRAVLEAKELRVYPVVRCRWCDHRWRFEWPTVMPYLHGELKQRLEVYAAQKPAWPLHICSCEWDFSKDRILRSDPKCAMHGAKVSEATQWPAGTERLRGL